MNRLKYFFLVLAVPAGALAANTSRIPWNTGLDYGMIVDGRDGRHYKTVQIDSLEWMAENLRFAADSSWCYDNDTTNCNTYGRLYSATQAITACQRGWHLAKAAEWMALFRHAGTNNAMTKLIATEGWSLNMGPLGIGRLTAYLAPLHRRRTKTEERRMAAIEVKGPSLPQDRRVTDRYGFRILPAGIHSTPGGAGEQAYVQVDLSRMTKNQGGEFGMLGSHSYFWSADNYDTTFTWFADNRVGYTITSALASMESFGFSVRCIADSGR